MLTIEDLLAGKTLQMPPSLKRTTEPNGFMKPIHEKAMPVILSSIEEQKLWLTEGDEELLRPFKGEMEFDQLPDTLEHLYPDENRKY